MTQRPMPSLEDRHLRSHASAPSAAQSFGRQHASRLYAQREANETETLRSEDLEAGDLARQLGELTLKTYSLAEPAKPQRTDKDLLREYAREERAVFAALEAASPNHHDPSLPVSLALCFAVWSFGLVMLDYSAQGTAYAGKDPLNAHFSRYSRTGLALAKAVESPTLDALRTMLLLARHETLVSPGEEGRIGVAMIALAAQACLQLDLHRDPDSLSTDVSPDEAEDRRNLFHATLLQDNQVATYIGRRFILLRSIDWNTRVPVDSDAQGVTDTGFGETHTMTSFLRALSVMTERITRAQFRSSPVPYSHILDLDGQLVDLVKCMPAFLKVDGITSEAARLPTSRTSFFGQRSVWGCATYVRISAATVLAIDLMFHSERQGASEDKAIVEKLVKHLSSFTTVSTLARRGSRLLQFLLDKVNSRSLDRALLLPERKVVRRAASSSAKAESIAETAAQAPPFPSVLPPPNTYASAPPPSRRPRPGSSPPLPSSHDVASTSGPASTSSDPDRPLSTLFRTAVEEIAQLDFPALLGVDGTESIFSFGDYGAETLGKL
ncbi:hypothetical protein JCM10207_002165 [Rhodosporidiobolus poonsookiae]